MGALTRTLVPQTIDESGRGQHLAYLSEDMNYIMRETFQDDYGVYQSNYNLFRHLNVNKKGTFTIHTIQGDPLLVQAYKSCFTQPVGGSSTGQRKTDGGCPVYIKQQQCHDAWMMEDCYRDYIEYRDGRVEETQLFSDVMDIHKEELFANSKLALRATQFVGQLYDPAKLDSEGLWADGITEEKKARFRKTTGACRGLLPRTADLAQKTGHEYLHDTKTIDDLQNLFDIENCRFEGDLQTWMETLIKRFPKKLRKAAVSGRGPRTRNATGRSYVYIAVSEPLYPIFQQAVIEEDKGLLSNGRCWTYQDVMTADGGMERVIVYRNTLIIVPDTWTCTWDEYTKCDTLSIMASVSGNVELGTSFTKHINDIEGMADDDFGMVIQKNLDPSSDHYQKWTYLMYSLLYQGINDPTCHFAAYKIVKN